MRLRVLLGVAQEKLEDRIRVCLWDAKQLPFEPGSFDLVISNNMLHRVRDPLIVLREIHRVASPRGAGFRLRRKLSLAIGPFGAGCTALVEHPQLAELWPEYLIRQHQIIRATVPLTEAALRQARALPAGP